MKLFKNVGFGGHIALTTKIYVDPIIIAQILVKKGNTPKMSRLLQY